MTSIIPSVVPATMSSREIAELTGKEHRNVLADIRNMLEKLEIDCADFSAQYKDSTGRSLPCFNLPKRETLILVSGYDIPMRARIIDRWQELETQAVTPAIPHTKPTIREERELQLLARDTMRTLKAFGIVGNAAVLSTDNYCRAIAGRSLLEPLGATHLLADPRGRTYTPTELGKMCNPPLSAIKLNLALEQAGLQKRDMGEWMPTDKAAGLCEWLDTGKRHSNGTPVKQLKWFATVLDWITQGGMKEAA